MNHEKELEVYYIKLFPIEYEAEYKMYVRSIELAESKINRLEFELQSL